MPDRAPDCDLHPYFRDPDKARAILDVCILECRNRGLTLVRVIHGKGKGDFRNLVQSHLRKHADVEGFILCDPLHGGSGATWVHIKPDPQFKKQPETDNDEKAKKTFQIRLIEYILVIFIIYISIPSMIATLIATIVMGAIELFIFRMHRKNE